MDNLIGIGLFLLAVGAVIGFAMGLGRGIREEQALTFPEYRVPDDHGTLCVGPGWQIIVGMPVTVRNAPELRAHVLDQLEKYEETGYLILPFPLVVTDNRADHMWASPREEHRARLKVMER